MLVGLIGLKGSGKGEAAKVLIDNGFSRVKFASPLKRMLLTIGLTERHIEGDLKEVPCALLGGQTPRWAMQSLGTEWGRQCIGENFWVDLAGIEIGRHLAAGTRVVVDDVRFWNEADKIVALGGVLIRIDRPGLEYDDTHESERHILTLPYDRQVVNDGDLDDLKFNLLEAVL